MTSIYCYGDIMYEQHIFLEENSGSNDTLVREVKNKVGGSSFNAAKGLSEMGHNVSLICSIGKDFEGKYIKEELLQYSNIKTDFVDFSNFETAKVFAIVNNLNDHKFLSFRCKNIKLKNIIEKIEFYKNDILNISGYSFQDHYSRSISYRLIEKCITNSAFLLIDPSLNYAKNFNKIKNFYPIDYFFPNQEEASIISRVDDYIEAAKILHTKNIKNVLITLGGIGCYFSNSEHKKLYKLESSHNHSLTIGAGDNFVAGFISAKVKNLSIEECINNANKSAIDYLNSNN